MRTYSYTVNGARYDVTIESLRDQVAKLNVNGVAFDVEILGAPLTEGDLPEVAAAAAPAAPVAAAPKAEAAPAPAAKGAAGAGEPSACCCRSSCEEGRHCSSARSHEDGKQHHG